MLVRASQPGVTDSSFVTRPVCPEFAVNYSATGSDDVLPPLPPFRPPKDRQESNVYVYVRVAIQISGHQPGLRIRSIMVILGTWTPSVEGTTRTMRFYSPYIYGASCNA